VGDIRSFKREYELVPDESGDGDDGVSTQAAADAELDLRAEDDARVAAALEAEQEEADDEEATDEATDDGADEPADGAADDDDRPRRRRRGRRGGRGRRRRGTDLEGTFDHGEEGYGLWLDPAVQDDPVYAEHWAGHRSVTVSVEPERIVISRAGEDTGDDDEES